MSSKPVFILTPGAWHTIEIYDRVVPLLEKRGYTAVPIDLPSMVQKPPVKSFDEDIQTIRDAVTKEADAGNDVVTVAHSWSGAPVNSALDALSKEERAKEGKKGGVVHMSFLCAFVVPPGVSVFDVVGQKVPDLWNVQGDLVYANGAVEAFYNDLSEEDQKHAVAQLVPHSRFTKYDKTRGMACKDIPSSYLLCELDQAIPIFAQEAMVKGAHDMGSNMRTERIKCGHSPFYNMPEAVTDFLIRAAGGQ
ncbi:alpha/beta-hydrolase [Rhizodiscina lignyota]|uniref:Alpha/beta-hydrolase n=1 Tax=Rhizodiscina lignyota TaxID=1504668 RepID=A0A9P4M4G9_9PEZI|nr:alpha/beta-hydrolase [Rhizodiscina lignyota]